MRWLLSGVLFLVGAVILYPFAAGSYTPPGLTATAEPWSSALDPLWSLDWVAASALFIGTSCTIFGAGLLFWSKEEQRSIRHCWSWASILQAGLVLNVLLGAMLCLAVSLAVRSTADIATVGHLYLLCALVVSIGSYLAFALFFLEKPKLLYRTTLTLHAVEATAVVAVFVTGYGG